MLYFRALKNAQAKLRSQQQAHAQQLEELRKKDEVLTDLFILNSLIHKKTILLVLSISFSFIQII